MTEHPLISVVVLSHDRFDLLQQALLSIERQTYRPLEIILVDNESPSSPAIRAWAAREHPTVRLVPNPNTGYAGGMNRGLREASGEYVEFHTDDIVHAPEYFRRVIEALPALGNWGAINGIVYEGRGSRIIRYCGGDIHFGVDYYLRIRGFGDTDRGQYPSPLPTQFSGGANLFMPTALARAQGGFDQDFFMYYEDVDLSLRLAAQGYRGWVVPAARCHHLGHALGTVTEAGRRYLERNLDLLYRKRGGWPKYAAHRLFQAALPVKQLLIDPFTPQPAREGNALFEFWNRSTVYHQISRDLNKQAPDERRRMAALVPRTGLVLDLGCGTAENALLLDDVDRYVGGDISLPALAMAADYGLSRLACCDLARLPFKSGAFDAVISTQVLEHLHQPQQVLAELGRVCRAGARIIIIAPRWDWPFDNPGTLRPLLWGKAHLRMLFGFARIAREATGIAARALGHPTVRPLTLTPRRLSDDSFLPDDDAIYLVGTDEAVAMVRQAGFRIEAVSPRDRFGNRSDSLFLVARKMAKRPS